ncbi:ead/Ea22-like family protein [Delftia acidovorans]|uniref:ead/Ea22-like family protein n=1 Tax=Delftia acidovorans TaxID=80866 RepID=UPI001EDD8C5B|nr:ead/Ea22-like family protein [Delftia acidovorans]MCG3782731.1 ead/Ea22-like family protein [Delftia acidovorans]
MTTAPTPDLRTLAEAVKNWSTCNEAWPHAEHFDVAMVGGITDGEQYPLAQIDADTYGTDGESLKLAQFYAAANPGAVLALLDRVAELEARLVTEASATAEHKLRADQPAQQHRMQAQMHAQATQQLAELEARKPLPLSDAEIIAAQEALALSRSRIGLPCTRCGTGKYRADRNAYHDFHRCNSCMHVPMWDADGNELGATGPLPGITGGSS